MDGMEEKLGQILNNPQLMQQIMSMAQSMNQDTNQSTPQAPPKAPPDMSALNRISDLMNRASIDNEQQGLLKALGPYLSREKLRKLERAMHAAKLAGAASSLMNQGGFRFLGGR